MTYCLLQSADLLPVLYIPTTTRYSLYHHPARVLIPGRFLDEMVTIGVLRLFEVFLGDGPTLVMLARDDVWGRSDDWDVQVNGEWRGVAGHGRGVRRDKGRWSRKRRMVW